MPLAKAETLRGVAAADQVEALIAKGDRASALTAAELLRDPLTLAAHDARRAGVAFTIEVEDGEAIEKAEAARVEAEVETLVARGDGEGLRKLLASPAARPYAERLAATLPG